MFMLYLQVSTGDGDVHLFSSKTGTLFLLLAITSVNAEITLFLLNTLKTLYRILVCPWWNTSNGELFDSFASRFFF